MTQRRAFARSRAVLLRWTGALSLLAVACGSSGSDDAARPKSQPSSAAAPASRVDARPRLVVLGDSLTAGLGLNVKDAYPTLLQQKLDAAGIGLTVVNAGVSGDTSAGGLSRIDLALEGDVRLMLVALGGNDALRALPVDQLRRNLGTIIERAQSRSVTVVLAGMEAPPNFGQDYTTAFRDVYIALAEQYKVPFVPFLLQGVAGVARLNQPDGIHPTAEGARLVADHIWPIIEPLARGAASAGTSSVRGTPRE